MSRLLRLAAAGAALGVLVGLLRRRPVPPAVAGAELGPGEA